VIYEFHPKFGAKWVVGDFVAPPESGDFHYVEQEGNQSPSVSDDFHSVYKHHVGIGCISLSNQQVLHMSEIYV
jgi:hypothetical protein